MKKFFKLLLLAFTLAVSLGAVSDVSDAGGARLQPSEGAASEGGARLLPSPSGPASNNASDNPASPLAPDKPITTTTTAVAAAPATSPALPSMGAAVFRMVGSLAIVIALLFAAAWVFRNMHRFKSPGAANRKLQVLEAKSLGPRQAVYVVGYEQQRLLIGATAQGLTLLTHLPESEVKGEVQSAPQPDAQPATPRVLAVSFGEALMQALGRK